MSSSTTNTTSSTVADGCVSTREPCEPMGELRVRARTHGVSAQVGVRTPEHTCALVLCARAIDNIITSDPTARRHERAQEAGRGKGKSDLLFLLRYPPAHTHTRAHIHPHTHTHTHPTPTGLPCHARRENITFDHTE